MDKFDREAAKRVARDAFRLLLLEDWPQTAEAIEKTVTAAIIEIERQADENNSLRLLVAAQLRLVAWQCDWCQKAFENRTEVLNHMAKCSNNPQVIEIDRLTAELAEARRLLEICRPDIDDEKPNTPYPATANDYLSLLSSYWADVMAAPPDDSYFGAWERASRPVVERLITERDQLKTELVDERAAFERLATRYRKLRNLSYPFPLTAPTTGQWEADTERFIALTRARSGGEQPEARESGEGV